MAAATGTYPTLEEVKSGAAMESATTSTPLDSTVHTYGLAAGAPWYRCYKTFYGRNLKIFLIS